METNRQAVKDSFALVTSVSSTLSPQEIGQAAGYILHDYDFDINNNDQLSFILAVALIARSSIDVLASVTNCSRDDVLKIIGEALNDTIGE